MEVRGHIYVPAHQASKAPPLQHQYPLDKKEGHAQRGLDMVVKRKVSAPAGNKTSVIQPTTISSHFTNSYWLIYII